MRGLAEERERSKKERERDWMVSLAMESYIYRLRRNPRVLEVRGNLEGEIRWSM